jgi:hypothetical protein
MYYPYQIFRWGYYCTIDVEMESDLVPLDRATESDEYVLGSGSATYIRGSFSRSRHLTLTTSLATEQAISITDQPGPITTNAHIVNR